jgi:hypothetical protein
LKAIPFESYGTEMLAVAAVLPLKLNRRLRLTFKIQLTQYVISVLTFDWALSRREESSLVLRTEYSHFRCSLRRITVQRVLGSQHKANLEAKCRECRGDKNNPMCSDNGLIEKETSRREA